MSDPTVHPAAAQPEAPAPSAPPAYARPADGPAPAPGYGAQPGQPVQPGPPAQPAGTFPGKGLGIAGLVFAFLVPLVGLILSLIAKSQSKKAGAKNTPAKVGVVVSSVLLALSIVIAIVSVVIFANLAAQLAEACATLGPGVHQVDAVTYTCN